MKRLSGFTLIQLLTTLAVFGILTTQALPAMKDLITKSNATATINRIYGQLQFARSLALAEGKNISVCGYSVADQCDSDWSKGIKIFYDQNYDGKLDTGEVTARVFTLAGNKHSLTINAAASVKYLMFTPIGTATSSNGNIVYCPEPGNANYAKVLIYYRSGRVYFGQDNNNNGIPENGSDKDVSC